MLTWIRLSSLLVVVFDHVSIVVANQRVQTTQSNALLQKAMVRQAWFTCVCKMGGSPSERILLNEDSIFSTKFGMAHARPLQLRKV